MKSKGILFILLATFSFALMNVLAKYLSGFHPMQVVFFRALGTFVFIFPFMIYKKIPILGQYRKLLLFRSVAGLISLATFFMAIQRIPLGSAISIRYLGPIFGAFLAYLFLKEKVNIWQWLSFLFSFTGVLVLKGFDVRIDYYSLFLCMNSALFVGMVFVLIRYLVSREHYLTIINHFMVVCIAGSLLFINYWRWPLGQELMAVLSIGVLGMIGQIFMTRAFELEETSVLAPFKYMELVYALILGLILFDESYTFIAFIGILMIILGMIANVYFKKKNKITQVSKLNN